MKSVLAQSWPLFLGFALLMIGNGLQGTLLGLRATIENYDTTVIGLIMSCYFGGYLLGSLTTPKLLARVGHIRVFAALAAMAAICILLHGLFVHPLAWAIIRIFSGLSFAGLYVVVESWLNDLAQAGNRGRILSIYMMLSHGGLAAGQLLLPVADPAQMELFVIIAILISLALLPIALIPRSAPNFAAPARLGLRELFHASPLGVVATACAGVLGAVALGIGPVYAAQTGLQSHQIGLFIASIILGGMISQLPMGWLSDRFDHRKMILVTSCVGAFMAALCALGNPAQFPGILAAILYGGMAMPLYGLAITHTNDHLHPSQFVSASASMLIYNGIGACLGPTVAAALMDMFGPHAFFAFIAVTFAALASFVLHRMRVRPPVPLDEQQKLVPMPRQATILTGLLFPRRKPGARDE